MHGAAHKYCYILQFMNMRERERRQAREKLNKHTYSKAGERSREL
jgi:hypothetical protein